MTRYQLALATSAICLLWASQRSDAQSQSAITLLAAASPNVAEPGVTSISVTGSNFPSGTITAAAVTITLTPLAGGTTATTPATSVTTIAGTTRRVAFTVPTSIKVLAPTAYAVTLAGATSAGVVFASSNSASLTVNPAATLTSVTPSVGQISQTVTVLVVGSYSNFVQGSTIANFGAGILVNGTTVSSATQASVSVTISPTATAGTRTVTMTTGVEVATLANAFSVTPGSTPPTIADFNPKSASVGSIITITGNNLLPNSGTAAQISLAKQGGGTFSILASSATLTGIAFVIPAGAATGPLTVMVNGSSATTASPLTLVPSSTYSIAVSPSSGNLIQGHQVAYSVQLTGSSGFSQLAQLSVGGLPAGVFGSFNPPSITSGQFSVLTLNAPAGQAVSTTSLTITATASVDGLALSQSATASLSITAPTTTLLGRTVVADSPETPLAGVTIKTLGLDGNGNSTGCINHAINSDAAGNFALSNLPANCVGPQLISFDGTTATSPAGKYAGVNLVFTLAAGQVTASPVLVHLPRIDTVETFLVNQSSNATQTYAFTSIPGLSVTVYPGTTFTQSDGTTPNPFPLAAVQVPVDRLPDAKPQVPTMMRVFIVAFQPANATASQPVAVYFPNTIGTAPGTDMALMTLDPTHGQMVPYGTGAVSADGTQIVPDPDPAHPGHLYGLVHFDWHGPMPPPPAQVNPAPPGSGSGSCSPVPGSQTGVGGEGACDLPAPVTLPAQPPPTAGTQSCPWTPPPLSPGLFQPTGIRGDLGVGRDQGPPAPPKSGMLPGIPDLGAPEEAGDPVDLFSGVMVVTNADIGFRGNRGSLSVVRTYRSMTTTAGLFGIGTGLNYSMQLNTASFVQANGNQATLVMPDGNQFLFSISANGGLVNSSIPAFRGAVLTEQTAGVFKLRWKNGTTYVFQVTSFSVLEAFLTAIIDPNGNQTTITLNPSQPTQVTQVTDPVGRALTFAYDSSGRITSITDPIGRTAQYAYNSQGTLASFTDPGGSVTHYAYDSTNNLLTITDPRGILKVQNTLDSNGRVIKQVMADGGTLNFTYSLLNPLADTSQVMSTTVSDSNAVAATYRFNPNGFAIGVTSTQGQQRLLPRASGTNLSTAIIEGLSTWAYTYDANGNVLSSTDPTGLTTQFTYEPTYNKLISVTDPLGNVTHYGYDARGNLTSATDANGNTSTFTYDPTGLLLQVTDALGNTTKYAYDAAGNLVTITDPLSATTSYTYDAISRLMTSKDAIGRNTVFSYDALGRLLNQTDARFGVTTYVYDANGNVLSVKDARGDTTAFSYDVIDRLASRTDSLGHSDSRTFDTDGNLTKFVDRRGVTSTFAYDNLNRLMTETYIDATVTRSYDFMGRLIQATDSASGTFGFTYDLAGRVTGTSSPNGSVSYRYDGRGFLSGRQVSDQGLLIYGYDAAGNLTSASLPTAGATFTYNARNLLATISRLNGVRSSYTYDSDGQPLTIAHTNGAVSLDTEGYTYDTVGNPLSHATSLGQSLTITVTANQYNTNNQLTLWGSVPDSYDANGNLVQEGTSTAYTWDGRNRLKSITRASGPTTTFAYDFGGNLISQSDVGIGVNRVQHFVLDLISNVAFQTQSDGSAYSVLAGRSIDSHLATVAATGAVQYGVSDIVNSTVATVDQSARVQAAYMYEPFGQTTTTGTYPFQFAGRTPVGGGLYYNRARFYNSQTGRFISEDPIGFGGGPNLYAYVRNNPQNATDPSGLLQSWDFNDYCSNICGPLMTGACALGCETPIGIAACGLILGGPGCTQYCKELDVYSQPGPKRNPPASPPTYIVGPPVVSTGTFNIYSGPLTPGTNTYRLIQ